MIGMKSRATQQDLTALDKCSDAVPQLVSKAIELADIIFDRDALLCGGLQRGPETLSTFRGRDEWLIRWLLKKLQLSGTEGFE